MLKYILDILSVIDELESILDEVDYNFVNFKENFVVKRAAERDLEIIGEALAKMLKEDSSITISHSKKIIGLRNIISHAYDSVEDEIIWGILVRHVPGLKAEIIDLKEKY